MPGCLEYPGSMVWRHFPYMDVGEAWWKHPMTKEDQKKSGLEGQYDLGDSV